METTTATSTSSFRVVTIEAPTARRTFLAHREVATFTAGKTNTGTLVATRTHAHSTEAERLAQERAVAEGIA